MLILFSCGCTVTTYTPDFDNGYVLIQTFQKKESIGKTDYKTREKDVLLCGVLNLDSGTLDLTKSYSKEIESQADKRYKAFYKCMIEKGYIHRYTYNCTKDGEDLHVCN